MTTGSASSAGNGATPADGSGTSPGGRQRYVAGPLPSRLGIYFPFLPFLLFLLFLATWTTSLPVQRVNEMLTEPSTYH